MCRDYISLCYYYIW